MSLFKFLFRRNDVKKQTKALDETPHNMESKLIITSTMGESSPTGGELTNWGRAQ
ncbi:hypothetical protein [Bacillus cereus]|uniref:hypothetical protein n=1 Tax=Bacillus cereus TaxID=1396 RepID=UPI00027A98C2|nr:hypothetical protein [Bacillus cereus]EJS63847.1 hypothetical protein ICU_04484 [Bacillus cereus BAG2X1-1]EJS70823.1 hypothetical protein ICY_04377 [Bacillus cereus BAG2X1-3]